MLNILDRIDSETFVQWQERIDAYSKSPISLANKHGFDVLYFYLLNTNVRDEIYTWLADQNIDNMNYLTHTKHWVIVFDNPNDIVFFKLQFGEYLRVDE